MIVKLIKKVIIFSGIWAILLYVICLFLPFHYFNAEYPMWLSKMEIMDNDQTYDNLMIGDSRVIAGLDPEVFGDDYYNLALGGGTPMEGYFMLKNMLAANKKIDTILVSYAPIHFEQSEMFWDRQLKYQFYDFEDIHEIFEELNNKNEIFWEYEGDKFFANDEREKFIRKSYLTYLKSPMELRTELGKSLLLRGYSNYQVYDQIKAQRGYYDFGKKAFSNELNVEAKRERFLPKEIIVLCLEKMFDLAKKNNIKVVYLSLPMNKTSYNALSCSYKKGVVEMHYRLNKKFPEVQFNDQGIVYYEDDFFGDSSHLNKEGRKKYSQEIKTRLASDYNSDSNQFITAMQFEE